MEMADTTLYKLELDPQKRNVFVTQLHEREDEEDVAVFPVVKESADKLIENGINTLQTTLLLKREVEVDRVNAELEAKRYEFKQRMDECAHRQMEVQKKQQQMKDRIEKFEKFIQENDTKRRRAIQKYQQEVKQREQKALEFISVSDQLEQYKIRHSKLQAKLTVYKVYKDYLQNVVDAMPEDYLPASDDKLKSLMMRHRTLSESNKILVDNLEAMSDELEECKKLLENLNEAHQQTQLSNTSLLSHLQEKQEEVMDETDQYEQNFSLNKGEMRAKRTEVGVIFMAIDNIYDKCKKTSDPPLTKADWNLKLSRIREYIQERVGVINIVHSSDSATSTSFSPEHTKARSKMKEKPLMKVTVTDH